MCVHIPEARYKELVTRLKHARIRRWNTVWSDTDDRSAAYYHRAVGQYPSSDDVDSIGVHDSQSSRLAQDRDDAKDHANENENRRAFNNHRFSPERKSISKSATTGL